MERTYQRLLKLPQKRHFFLFGARNTGKSTLLADVYDSLGSTWFDLLDLDLQARLQERPNNFYHMVKALPAEKSYVIIDEIQKVPALLDVVQRLMKDKEKFFIFSGSSARKLKVDGANLLAGRAFVYHLYIFLESLLA